MARHLIASVGTGFNRSHGAASLFAPKHLRIGAMLIALFILVTCGGAEEREQKYLERGKDFYEHGDYVKASLEFKNALQINPKGIDALFYLGLIDEKQGEFRTAFSKFNMVVSRKPDHIDAHLKLGNYYLLAGKIEDAVQHAETAKKLDPANPKQMDLFG
ncbi:MAG: tetratricopeptide repeat protein [Candidatus Binatia bacterium]